MIIKFKTGLKYDISSIITEENKEIVENMIKIITSIDSYSYEYMDKKHISFGEEHGKNFIHNIVSQTIINSPEEKKIFLDIFRIVANEYQIERPKEKKEFKNSQRENKWGSSTLNHPIIIPLLYELRFFIRPLFID